MPSPHPSKPNKTREEGLGLRQVVRSIALGLCLVITGWASASYATVRWAEQQILSTEGWVSYVSDLPQNPDVSWTVANTLVTQIFAGVPVEQKIREALPPQASFLSSPLKDQLSTRSVDVVQGLVQGDAFQSLWTGANRLAMNRFLTNARSDKITESPNLRERFTIDLANTRPLLSNHLASQAELSPALQGKSQELLAIRTDLRNRRERLWQAVRTIDFLYAILPFVCAAGFLGALVLADSQRRAIMLAAAIAVVFLLLTLIVVKYVREQIIAEVRVPQNIPAVTFIYDSLVADLRGMLFYGLGFWLIVLALCLMAGPARWAIALRAFLRLPVLARSRPADWWRSFQAGMSRYKYALWAGIAGVMLIYLAFFATISNVVLINSVLLLTCAILLGQLWSKPLPKSQRFS